MRLAMAEIEERLMMLEREYGILCQPLLTIHDELLIECPEDQGELVEAVLGEIMESCLTDKKTGKTLCRVPIKSDGKIQKRWIK